MPEQDQETLDPSNWEDMRQLGHRMIDDVIDHLSSLRERPVWQPPSKEMQQHLSTKAPLDPMSADEVYQQFVDHILPFPLGNTHPRFWAWYMGNGTVLGAFAEMLAATMNPNTGAGRHGAMEVEKQVLAWIGDFIGYPDSASGLLVSGGSMANLVGLVVARHHQANYDFRQDGYQFSSLTPPSIMRIYASTEVHSCNQKAVELMGMGHRSLRKIAVDAEYKIRLDLLEAAIKEDIDQGDTPICVIASAGTVNTGAIDDLEALAQLCKQYQIWFHVDGAIGGTAMIAHDIKPLLKGIELADSVVLDLHKWMHIPFEAGCIMVREGGLHREAFTLTPEYLAKEMGGVASGTAWFSEYGVQLSRNFRALKIWMTIKEHGLNKLGRMMSKNVTQAAYLAKLVEAHVELELCAPVGLDIVCYRWVSTELSLAQLNRINKAILVELQESGAAVPSYTTLSGVYCIRVAISNHRSERRDFDYLIDETVKIAAKVQAVGNQ